MDNADPACGASDRVVFGLACAIKRRFKSEVQRGGVDGMAE